VYLSFFEAIRDLGKTFFNSVRNSKLKKKNSFFLTGRFVLILIYSLALVLGGCDGAFGDPKDDDPPDERLDEVKGEIFGVIINYGDALNAENGGSYSVEIKNPRSTWRDIIIWETAYSHENVEEKNRNYTFMFHEDNFVEQFSEWRKFPDEYKGELDYIYRVIEGKYEVIIKNSFGYEKKYEVRVGISIDRLYTIVFNPGIMEVSVP
jgi:hypothetical protein